MRLVSLRSGSNAPSLRRAGEALEARRSDRMRRGVQRRNPAERTEGHVHRGTRSWTLASFPEARTHASRTPAHTRPHQLLITSNQMREVGTLLLRARHFDPLAGSGAP